MKRIKTGGLNVLLLFTQCARIIAPSTHGVYSECKVTWFYIYAQQSDWQRINKTQERKEEA